MRSWILIIMVYVLITAVLSSCITRKAEPLEQRSFAPLNDRVLNGERVFMMHCHKCHPGGEGGLGPSIVTNPAPQFIKRFQMRHGLGVMPSFKKNEISRKDLHDISKYLKEWRRMG